MSELNPEISEATVRRLIDDATRNARAGRQIVSQEKWMNHGKTPEVVGVLARVPSGEYALRRDIADTIGSGYSTLTHIIQILIDNGYVLKEKFETTGKAGRPTDKIIPTEALTQAVRSHPDLQREATIAEIAEALGISITEARDFTVKLARSVLSMIDVLPENVFSETGDLAE